MKDLSIVQSMRPIRRRDMQSRRRALLVGAAAISLASTAGLATLALPVPSAASVLDALEACGTEAESPLWAFEVHACIGNRQVMFTCGRAAGVGAGRLAARRAVSGVEDALREALGATLVVRGRYPDVLTYREANDARKEVQGLASKGAYVLYALCPDEDAAADLEVSLVVAIRS